MFGEILDRELEAIDLTEQNVERILNGLDPLNSLNQVFIYRNQDKTSGPKKNETRYEIIDNNGVKIFDAIEHNYAISRNCCNDLRKFELSILQTHDQKEILRFRRFLRGDCCFCFGCMQTMDILSCPDYSIFGSIEQQWSICRPLFVINLASGEMIFRVMGPCCTMRCCVRELNFDVTTHNKLGDVALISSQWTGRLRDEFAEVNFYGVQFHQEVNNKLKAMILGACFLVNALYYKI